MFLQELVSKARKKRKQHKFSQIVLLAMSKIIDNSLFFFFSLKG